MQVIKNGTLVTPEGLLRADIALRGGKIAEIGEITPRPGDSVWDAEGCWVFPGFIDEHTHLEADTGITRTSDDFAEGTRAAVCGGTTTVVDFATQEKGGTLADALKAWMRMAEREPYCNYAFHMAICDWNERTKAEIPALRAAGVSSYKVYLAYDHLRVTDEELYELLLTLRDKDAICGCHCEIGQMVNELQAREIALGHTEPAAHPVSRPPEVEAEAVARFTDIAARADCPVYVVHLSSAKGLDALRAARDRGQTVYAETCPQYLLLDDSLYSQPDFEGAKYVCSPPLRKAEDIAALRGALLNGEIDALATDHCAFNFKTQKVLGIDDFRRIPNGMPGIEHRAAALAKVLEAENRLDPVLMNRLLSEGPARLMNLYPRKGALQIGADADVTVWNPNERQTISAATQQQNVDYTPYEGLSVPGQAKYVFVNGKLAAECGKPTGTTAGVYVKR